MVSGVVVEGSFGNIFVIHSRFGDVLVGEKQGFREGLLIAHYESFSGLVEEISGGSDRFPDDRDGIWDSISGIEQTGGDSENFSRSFSTEMSFWRSILDCMML